MTQLPPLWTALWFLPAVVAIGIWVAWSDMKFMRIPNKAVMAMLLAYRFILTVTMLSQPACVLSVSV